MQEEIIAGTPGYSIISINDEIANIRLAVVFIIWIHHSVLSGISVKSVLDIANLHLGEANCIL